MLQNLGLMSDEIYAPILVYSLENRSANDSSSCTLAMPQSVMIAVTRSAGQDMHANVPVRCSWLEVEIVQ